MESRRTIIASGTDARKLRHIAPSRPFTQQLDVVFPSNSALKDALGELSGVSYACTSTLSDFLQFAKPHINQVAPESKVVALGVAQSTDTDVWSLDTRGILTLAVSKQTYQSLGIVGERLPWKEHHDTHVIHICVRGAAPQYGDMKNWATYGSKEAKALCLWDERRGPWKILYYFQDADVTHPTTSTVEQFEGSISDRADVHIPDLGPDACLIGSTKEEDVEDWEENVSSLFEWVGMAALGSQRLSANDRSDPYISVYTHPEPSRIGELTVMRWRGFIPSAFVQAVLDVIMSPNLTLPSFVSVTGHSVLTSPVTYLPTDDTKAAPLRAPRAEAEDTWSLVYARNDSSLDRNSTQESWWLLAESIGRWDKRWG